MIPDGLIFASCSYLCCFQRLLLSICLIIQKQKRKRMIIRVSVISECLTIGNFEMFKCTEIFYAAKDLGHIHIIILIDTFDRVYYTFFDTL